VVVVALVSAAPQPGVKPTTGPNDEADFTGKVLVVSVKEPASGAVMRNVRVKRLGGRPFLVGESVKRSDDGELPEVSYWFPVADVLLIREFKSFEDSEKERAFLEKAKKQQ
jgi:hypothetical protein